MVAQHGAKNWKKIGERRRLTPAVAVVRPPLPPPLSPARVANAALPPCSAPPDLPPLSRHVSPCCAAEHFIERTDVQCLHRWQKVLNPEVHKGPWTADEDDAIVRWGWLGGFRKAHGWAGDRGQRFHHQQQQQQQQAVPLAVLASSAIRWRQPVPAEAHTHTQGPGSSQLLQRHAHSSSTLHWPRRLAPPLLLDSRSLHLLPRAAAGW